MCRQVVLSCLLFAVLARECWSHEHHNKFHERHKHDGPRSSDAACGTHDPLDFDMMLMNAQEQAWEQNNANVMDDGQRNLAAKRGYVIPVFFHVLAQSDSLGTMTNKGLKLYIKNLNHIYRNSNFQFQFQGVQRRTGSGWHSCDYDDRARWMSRLHISGTNALNIYICKPFYTAPNENYKELYGFSSWPTNADETIDGVAIPHEYYYGRNESIQFLAHELGHYFGLLHTFANGCSSRPLVFEDMPISDGDGVQDTPAQAAATWEYAGFATCWQASQLDTCNDTLIDIDPGLDPVSNYMNYVDPVCWANYGEFTRGQNRRMLAMFEQFRLSSPWTCTNVGEKCRDSFECCSPRTVSCVKAPGRRKGKCVKNCASAGDRCRRNLDCCGEFVCSSGTCVRSVKRVNDNNGGGAGAVGGADDDGCFSVLCNKGW
ncbi:hypothetical protein MPSEU_000999300 [Mayamaea pseudoterrestris]|nr:hypothetical protein MPSEU_000999300 [Mayamaea pseudoterrestris]